MARGSTPHQPDSTPTAAVRWLCAQGWTQRAIAARAGCSQPTVGRVLRDEGCRYDTGAALIGVAAAARTAIPTSMLEDAHV